MLRPWLAYGLVQFGLTCFFYGFSLILFVLCLWSIRKRRPRQTEKVLYILFSCSLFSVSTAHFGVAFARIFRRVVVEGGENVDVFPKPDPFAGVLAILYAMQTAFANAILIYRVHILWNSMSAVLPCMVLLLTEVAMAILYGLSINGSTSSHVALGRNTWMLFSFSITLGCNVVTTGLLIYGLVTTERKSDHSRRPESPIPHALLIAVDSAVLYSVLLIFSVILVNVRPTWYITYTPSEVLPPTIPLISIILYAIIFRLFIIQDLDAPSKTEDPLYPPELPNLTLWNNSHNSILRLQSMDFADSYKVQPIESAEAGETNT